MERSAEEKRLNKYLILRQKRARLEDELEDIVSELAVLEKFAEIGNLKGTLKKFSKKKKDGPGTPKSSVSSASGSSKRKADPGSSVKERLEKKMNKDDNKPSQGQAHPREEEFKKQ